MAISSPVAAAITAITSIAGSAVSAYGQIQQQKVASAMAKREARATELQGMLAEDNTRLEAAELMKEQQRTAASQVVSGAGAGISLQSSSLVDLMDETRSLYAADIEQLRRTGALQSAASRYSGSSYKLAQKSGPGYFGAGATMLSGIKTVLTYGDKAGWFD